MTSTTSVALPKYTPDRRPIRDFFTNRRRVISRIVAVPTVLLVVFSHHSWANQGWMDIVVTSIGFVLVMCCAFGRLWAALFISGYKTKSLITVGPYSMVRNPLYLFSLIGAIGVGFAAENLILIVVLILLFGVYYPLVIAAEERKLAYVHGDVWLSYAEVTPRFLPRFSLYSQPDRYEICLPILRRAFFDVAAFPAILFLVEILEELQEMEIIPVYFWIP